MHAIFYDLETTDSLPLGQILNYSFIFVDDSFDILSELSGDIRISRLQLPRAGAILANRVNVLEHQKRVKDDELRGLQKIHEYLSQCVQSSARPLALIGFNSSKFDLNFLRTSFIRNGLDPYVWNRKLLERDMLLSVRKLAACDERFPRIASKDDPKKVSLRLENLGHAFDILQGQQTHHSRDDVLLTIQLARVLGERFSFDAVSYLPYEGTPCERTQRSPQVYTALELNYDLESSERAVRKPMTLLCADHRASLWVDLDAYEKGAGRSCIRNVKRLGGHALFLDLRAKPDDRWAEVAKKAQAEFAAINTQNFFGARECDIEMFIYRLDAADRPALTAAIREGDGARLKSMDAKILYRRFLLRNYRWGDGDDAAMERDLKSYALRRYGGEVLLSKSPEGDKDEGNPAGDYHPTFQMLVDEIDSRRVPGIPRDDNILLDALEQFYLESDIYRVAGEELRARGRLNQAA